MLKFNKTTEIEHGEFLLRYSGSQQARFMCGYQCLGPAGRAKTEEELLKRALENLKGPNMGAVGYLDRFADMLTVLRLHLKWVPPHQKAWPEVNVVKTAAKSVLIPEAAAVMRAWAWVDIKLYEEAVKIADRMIEEANSCFAKVEAYTAGAAGTKTGEPQ